MQILMFSLICAILPAALVVGAMALSPSAIAQQEDTSLGDEDLGSGIASDVLDNVGVGDEEEENDGAAATGDNDGDTNTQIAVPITDQDQREANLAEQLGLNVDILEEVEEEVTPTPTPPEEEEPPEFVAFCLEITNPEEEVVDSLCFDTSEECAEAQEFLEEQGFVISMECEGVETFPPSALECFISRDNQGEIVAVVCP